MTNKDELGLGNLVERLKPKWTVDETVGRAVSALRMEAPVLSSALNEWLATNNTLKREAADAITALIAERDGLHLAYRAENAGSNARADAAIERANAAETTRDAARTNFLTMQGTAATLLHRVMTLETALEKLACRHVTEQPLWWQIEARTALALHSKEGEKP